jgi:hypothetical protein
MRWKEEVIGEAMVGEGGGDASGEVMGERPSGERERKGDRKREETERFLPGALTAGEMLSAAGAPRDNCELAVEREEEVEGPESEEP